MFHQIIHQIFGTFIQLPQTPFMIYIVSLNFKDTMNGNVFMLYCSFVVSILILLIMRPCQGDSVHVYMKLMILPGCAAPCPAG